MPSKKVERDQSQGGEHDGKVVPQFPGLQKGQKVTAVQCEVAEPVDAVVDDPVFVLGAGLGEDPVDDDVHKPPVHMVQIPALGKELPEGRDPLDETDLRGSAAAELKPGHANAQGCQSCAEIGKPCMVPILVGGRAPREELAKRRLQESQHQGHAGQDDEAVSPWPSRGAHPRLHDGSALPEPLPAGRE